MIRNYGKLIKITILILSFGFGGLVFWMNLTPGYFRFGRDCKIEYLTDKDAQEIPYLGVINCQAKTFGWVLLNLARLDFNKGNMPGGVDGTQPISVPLETGQGCGGSPYLPCSSGYSCQVKDPNAPPASPNSLGICIPNKGINQQGFVCPKTEWVNCMPILTPEAQKSCTKEYLDWAKNNCPGFKGAAR